MKRPLALALFLLPLAALASVSCGSGDDESASTAGAGGAASGGAGCLAGASGAGASGKAGGGQAGDAGSGGEGQGGEGQAGAGAGGEGQAGSAQAGAGQGGSAGAGAAGEGGAGGEKAALCAELKLPARPFAEGPHGKLRGQLAGDFSLPLLDGSTWSFAQAYSGCESYIFLPDTLTVSQKDSTSLWAADLPALLKLSPRTVHYFFVSRASSSATAQSHTEEMGERVDAALAALSPSLAAHWKGRLHVVSGRAAELGNWVGEVLMGHGAGGFAIDRLQKVRGVGSLADVDRFSDELQTAGAWPWKANLAYAAYEARYFDAQAKQQAALDEEKATVVKVFDGETLEQFAEKDIELPPADVMAAFDTLQVEITMACPDAQKIEFGNCGAWDYLATLGVDAGEGKFTEIARFITSYHRETRWVVDASPMLALLGKGGKRRLRWDFAPEWNKQPTATRMELRLSNRAKPARPSEATFLFSGGPFDAAYNDNKSKTVVIPADAKKVEVYLLVTGHGADAYQCAEFCAHLHEVTVNEKVYSKKFKEAGSSDGCIDRVSNGMVPNQGGTWWFGRGGWCPGMQVDPWVLDVTADVTPGKEATISYRGLFAGLTPVEKLGDIQLSSYLVVSR